MPDKKALIVVNPISGGIDKAPILKKINQHLSKSIEHEVVQWLMPGEFSEIKKRIKDGDHQLVIAVGGDGTINQVAQELINTEKTLGIIPVGSGNGLARHLKIPLKVEEAVQLINKGNRLHIDSCTVNGIFYLCTSGVGFDALIGKLFAESKTRGFFTYFKLTIAEFIRYQPQEYTLWINNEEIRETAFLITVANASQYGNNAYIAPQADIQDGLLDVCIIKPFKPWQMPFLGIRIFNKTIPNSSLVRTFKTDRVIIKRKSPGPIHFDGEPAELDTTLEYKIDKQSIKIIA